MSRAVWTALWRLRGFLRCVRAVAADVVYGDVRARDRHPVSLCWRERSGCGRRLGGVGGRLRCKLAAQPIQWLIPWRLQK